MRTTKTPQIKNSKQNDLGQTFRLFPLFLTTEQQAEAAIK